MMGCLGIFFFPDSLIPNPFDVGVGTLLVLVLLGLLLFVVFGTIFQFFYAALMQLAVIMLSGKGKFNDTFKVMCYSYAPINLIWIFALIMMASLSFGGIVAILIALPSVLAFLVGFLYVYYIVIAGISITSEMTKLRALAAVIIHYFIYSFVVMTLGFGLAFLFMLAVGIESGYQGASYATTQPYESEIESNFEKYATTVYVGSTPTIDGSSDGKDSWFEGEQIYIEARGKYYTIVTKHDFENVYVLMEWEGTPEWEDEMAIWLEQDGRSADFNEDTGLVDRYNQGHYKYGPASLYDYSTLCEGSLEEQNGIVRGVYEKGYWTLEWQIPQRSGDDCDIYIDEYPTHVGFSIINWRGGANGIWPPAAWPYNTKTWGNMTIVDEKIR
jgi:hypothetical protein